MQMPSLQADLPPRCESCGTCTAQIGKLPRIGLRPLVYVYKCGPCNQITAIEAEPRHVAPVS
jgi:DNA-directed RNA polymerase subunit RPC12/RpoP